MGLMQLPMSCPKCAEEPPRFREGRSLLMHRDSGAALVHQLKYGHAPWLSEEITRLLGLTPHLRAFFENAYLVPVPLHRRKWEDRGYNQAALVAQAVHRFCPSSRIWPCLRRVQDTQTQTALSREDRIRNVSGAFGLQPRIRLDPSRRYVLVDDVFTTGSTLNACTRELHRGGAQNVYGFTLAHG